MGIHDILSKAPGLLVIWILVILLILLLGILYVIQNSQSSKVAQGDTSRTESVRNLGNAMGGVGIGICLAGVAWVILLAGLMRDSFNISEDPSSLFVSRNNLLFNWFSSTVTTAPSAQQSISGSTPQDGSQYCFAGFSQPNDPTAYDKYKAFIAAYQKGPVNQTYLLADGHTQLPVSDDIATQRKLTLAYYRFMYCTQTYFSDILNKNWANITFLPEALANLKLGKSNCGLGNLPDTQACQDGGTPGTCNSNPCFDALNESIAAQCLLYDDHVYNRINASANPRGALAAFDLATDGKNSFGSSVLPGYQVQAPK